MNKDHCRPEALLDDATGWSCSPPWQAGHLTCHDSSLENPDPLVAWP